MGRKHQHMTQLADSVVLVTGANGGLGAEFVRQALLRGAGASTPPRATPATGRTAGWCPSPSTSPRPRAVYETNVFGPIAVAQALAPVLAKNGGGALIDIHSVLSWLARPGAYPSTKAALWSVTNTLRLELAGQGTQVVGAHLGYADTPMTALRTDVDKADPRDIVAAIYHGLEAGEAEVLADDTSRQIKLYLSQPLTALYPELAS